jgi:phosphomevalonate kinase
MTGSDRTTLRGSPVVFAPGKVFLIGEYAVLEGGVAVLAAAGRYAVGQYVPELAPSSGLVAEVARRAVLALGELSSALPSGAVLVDTSQFERDGTKLGLGSSAAAAVATAGAIFEHAGVSVATHQELLYSIADAGHRTAQGGLGSGADVAAAVHGGFIQYFRPKDGAPAVVRLNAPTGLTIIVFWVQQAARTVDLVRAVQALATRNAPLYKWMMDELRAGADRFAKAFASNDARGVLEAADAYGRTLAELGEASAVPIVTRPFEAAATLARSLGGAAKPSGAGGGDIGVAFFANPGAATTFAAQCPDGVLVLDIRLGAAGAHRRLPTGIEMFKKD